MADDLRGDEKSPSKGRRGSITCVFACFGNSRRNAAFNHISSKEHALRECLDREH